MEFLELNRIRVNRLIASISYTLQKIERQILGLFDAAIIVYWGAIFDTQRHIFERGQSNGGDSLNITLERLMEMKNDALQPINKESLVDIRDIKIKQELPVTEKILEFIALTKNPYLYKYGDKVIRISFSETDVSFEERIKSYFEML